MYVYNKVWDIANFYVWNFCGEKFRERKFPCAFSGQISTTYQYRLWSNYVVFFWGWFQSFRTHSSLKQQNQNLKITAITCISRQETSDVWYSLSKNWSLLTYRTARPCFLSLVRFKFVCELKKGDQYGVGWVGGGREHIKGTLRRKNFKLINAYFPITFT